MEQARRQALQKLQGTTRVRPRLQRCLQMISFLVVARMAGKPRFWPAQQAGEVMDSRVQGSLLALQGDGRLSRWLIPSLSREISSPSGGGFAASLPPHWPVELLMSSEILALFSLHAMTSSAPL